MTRILVATLQIAILILATASIIPTSAELKCYECVAGRLVSQLTDTKNFPEVNYANLSEIHPRMGADDSYSCMIGSTPKNRYEKSCPANKCLRLKINATFGDMANGLFVIRGCIQSSLNNCTCKTLQELSLSATGDTKMSIEEIRKLLNSTKAYTSEACFCDKDKCNHAATFHSSGFISVLFVASIQITMYSFMA